MRRSSLFTIRILVVLMFALATGIAYGSADCGDARRSERTSNARKFLIFDGTLYLNKEDFSPLGIRPIKIVYGEMWDRPENHQKVPDKSRVVAIASSLPRDNTPVVLDVEQWPFKGSADVVAATVVKLQALVSMFKASAPDKAFGYYSLLPTRDYWRSIEGISSPQYRLWQAENDRLAALAKDVDALFPSVYTFYEDRDGWRRYAIAQICEARRLSTKPVFAFLWPEYHVSSAKLKGTYLDRTYWRMQLNTMRSVADGVVIWGGWDNVTNQRKQWDGNAPWWQETKAFALQVKNTSSVD